MSKSSSQTKATAVREIEIGSKAETYEFLISLPEENISKILSVDANVEVDNIEVLSGELSFSGKACLNLVYELEDGSISSNKTCENFSGKFDYSALSPTNIVNAFPSVIDVSIEKAANDSVKIKLKIENKFIMTDNQEIDIYIPEETVFSKQTETSLTQFIAHNCQVFSQMTDFDLKIPAGKILNATSVATIEKADALDGMIIFEGDIVTKILYSSNEDRPLLITLTQKQNFREEIEDGNSTKDSLVEAFARVLNYEIETKLSEDLKEIEVSVPVKICYSLFEAKPVNIIVDAYSTENDIKLTTEAFLSNSYLGNETVYGKIDGNVSIDEQALRIDKTLAVDGAYLTITNQFIDDGEFNAEGLVHANIIYLNDDESSINSVSVEIPFKINEKLSTPADFVKAEISIIDIDAAVKRGRDIYLDGKTKATIWLSNETQNAIVSGAEIEELSIVRDGAIEIYFASDGQTFWDIAKELKIPEDILKQQNEGILEPFSGNEKIIYYFQKNYNE